MAIIENLIIGAGPSGLAVAGRLSKLGIQFEILEKSDKVGISWRNHYERLHLHTDKKYSALPHLPFPADYPMFISRNQYITYLDHYCEHFNIRPVFNQHVIAVSKEAKHWVVNTNGRTYEACNVLIATGYNRVPKMPTMKGQEVFRGEMLHSEKYKNGKPYKGKNVLVLGYGNSGAEIALDLYENGANVFVSIRNPVNIIKREFKGFSTQSLAIFCIRLGNTVYDFVGRQFKKLLLKAAEGTGIPISTLAPSEQLRVEGKVAVIDVGTLAQIKAGNIKVMPGIEELTANKVVFVNGVKLSVDAIVMATGYHARLEEIMVDVSPLLNERGYPKALWFEEEAYKGLYFIGFKLPLTGILRDINLSSEKIIKQIMASS